MAAWSRLSLCLTLCLYLALASALTEAAPAGQDARRLHYGEVARGRLSDTVTEDAWEFAARAGDAILIDMKAAPGSGLDTYLSLSGPDGTSLSSDDDNGEGLDARIGPFEIPAGGTYHITASRYGGIGEYTLQVVDLTTLPTLQRGKPLAGQLSASHPADYFLLRAPAAVEDAFWQVSTSTDDPYNTLILTVLGLSALPVTTEDSGGEALGPLVLSPGVRYVAIVTRTSESSGGAYEIRFGEADVSLLEDGQPQTGELPLDGESQRFFFRGTNDERVTITVRSHDRVPITVSVGLIGSEEALFQTGGVGMFDVSAGMTLPQDALYTVDVSLAGTEYGGAYTVTLTRLAD